MEQTGPKDHSRPSDDLHPDDGVDPRVFFDRRQRSKGPDHKLEKLCHQVAERVQMLLGWECADERLAEVTVAAVTPLGGASRLSIEIAVPAGQALADVEAALAGAAGLIRTEVAASIHRRRVPELAFVVVRGDGG